MPTTAALIICAIALIAVLILPVFLMRWNGRMRTSGRVTPAETLARSRINSPMDSRFVPPVDAPPTLEEDEHQRAA